MPPTCLRACMLALENSVCVCVSVYIQFHTCSVKLYTVHALLFVNHIHDVCVGSLLVFTRFFMLMPGVQDEGAPNACSHLLCPSDRKKTSSHLSYSCSQRYTATCMSDDLSQKNLIIFYDSFCNLTKFKSTFCKVLFE